MQGSDFGTQLDGSLKPLGGFVETFCLIGDDAEAEDRIRIGGVEGDHLLKKVLGFRESTGTIVVNCGGEDGCNGIVGHAPAMEDWRHLIQISRKMRSISWA